MREFKSFPLEVKEIDEAGQFTGYASVFGNEDSYGDVVERGAFKRTIKAKGGQFPMLWQHEPWEPIGLFTEAAEDDTGLTVQGHLNLDTQRGAEGYSLLKQGALRGMSIGYETINSKPRDGRGRNLTEIRLWEISLVTFPANERALVGSIKSGRFLEALGQWAAEDPDGFRAATSALLERRDPADATRDDDGLATSAADSVFTTPGAIVNHVFGGSR